MTYDSSSDTNSPNFYVNNLLVAMDETSTPTGTSSSDAGLDFIIGNNSGNSRTFDGGIAQFIIYTRILPSDERVDVFKFLSSKFGIALD